MHDLDRITKQQVADTWGIYHSAFDSWQAGNISDKTLHERLNDACNLQDRYNQQEKERKLQWQNV